MNIHVHSSRNLGDLLTELLGDFIILLLVMTDDLNIDRRREPGIQNLADNIRGLHKKCVIRVLCYQLLPDSFNIIPGRTMLLLVERHQDLAVGGTDCGSVTQSEVKIHRQTNISEHKINLVLRDDASDDILHLGKYMLGFLNPRARRRPHVQPELTCINQRKEILAEERRQEYKREKGHPQGHANNQASMHKCPL